MKHKTIADIVGTMTYEEIQEHEDLIDECLEREKMNEKYSGLTKKNMDKLHKICDKMRWDFNKVKKVISEISPSLQKKKMKIH